ncbi:RNA polymerase sigma factor [Microbacterium faecale]|nr:sigma-70 family RNA polymerase sigma factor [Microbacterium faecale]HJB63165.1 sigma-70 family RNA polymerase sigma factor [Candidatus Microbacterium pullistercoris]
MTALPTSGDAAHWFARWRDGDARAMDELVREMTPVLWHIARSYSVSASVAEDVVQSTWLALVRKHDMIEDPAAVAGWLITTVRREAWRAAGRARRSVSEDDLERRLPPAASVEEEIVVREEEQHLWRAVHTLDDRCRRLLRVVAFSVRPDYENLAVELDMPVGSIGPTRRRCLTKLKKLLQESPIDCDPASTRSQ